MTERHATPWLAATILAATLTACSGGPAQPPAQPPQPATAMAAPPAAPAHEVAASGVDTVTGAVAETINSGGYTYLRLQTGNGDVWIAASEFPVKAGERLTVPLEMPMRNFHSKTLNRDFPLVYFVSQVAREGQALAAPPEHGGASMAGDDQADAAAPVKPVAPAAGGLSIADVWSKRTSLAGKQVVVRGQVVKVNNGIMDRNWFHLQDGSGSADARTNDLTVTSADTVNMGDVVTVSGVLAIGKDFGAGYAYDAILEKAAVTGK